MVSSACQLITLVCSASRQASQSHEYACSSKAGIFQHSFSIPSLLHLGEVGFDGEFLYSQPFVTSSFQAFFFLEVLGQLSSSRFAYPPHSKFFFIFGSLGDLLFLLIFILALEALQQVHQVSALHKPSKIISALHTMLAF
ncbi:hypothetical protein PTKIN_Ptkin02bG0206000 [Pterospermum kingtungense]